MSCKLFLKKMLELIASKIIDTFVTRITIKVLKYNSCIETLWEEEANVYYTFL